jgi:subtilisin family serine protease
LSVGSHTPNAEISSFSNTGACVRLYAPGEPIEAPTVGDFMLVVSGTSFAAPLVSGLAALVFAHQPSMTDAQVVDLLLTRAYSAKSVLFAKNPYPSPAELNGVPDIGTNVPYSGAGDLFPSTAAVVLIFFMIAFAYHISND